MPPTGELLAAGIPVGLSVDTTELSGNADMFAIMKVIQNVENGRAESEFALPPRRVLELATLEGARSMGIDDQVGSLKPGKRADLILVALDDVNIGPLTDPAHLLVEAAQPANVYTVVVDGRILKHERRLTALDPRQIVREADAALCRAPPARPTGRSRRAAGCASVAAAGGGRRPGARSAARRAGRRTP